MIKIIMIIMTMLLLAFNILFLICTLIIAKECDSKNDL